MRVRIALLVALLPVQFISQAAAAADRLILRNLDIIADRTVTAFDEDGVQLDGPRPGGGGELITWDEIERGKIALDQPRFDKLLGELGPPLYRIRQRLKIGDYEAAGEPAELLYSRFAERKSQTAYLVCQATMWSRAATGKRETAVEPYLRCYEMLRVRAATSGGLPGARRLQIDPMTAISAELAPVWFDPAAAKNVLPAVQQAIRQMAQPRPEGAYVYYATLAIAASEASEAERVLSSLGSGELATPWRDIVLGQQELASDAPRTTPALDRLKARRDLLPEPCRPLAIFLIGLSDYQSNNPETAHDGILNLLTLPAVYGETQPELAAAGLYHAAQALDKLNDRRGAAAVRRELASRYAGTQLGAKQRGEAKR
jgi:hypothetical protein